MASAKAIALMESIYARVDKQVRDILATLPGVTVPAQQDGVVVSAQRRIYNFQGAGVVVTDDPSRNRINVAIPGAPTASTTASVYSTTGSFRILTPASPTYTFPGSWQTHGFDDSAWTTSVDETLVTPIDSPSSSWQGTGTDQTDADQQQAYRQVFSLAGTAPTLAELTIWADNFLLEIYVNGHALSGYSTTTEYVVVGTPITIDVPLDWLTLGGSNTLAVKINNATGGGNNRMRVNFRLRLTLVEGGADDRYQLLSEKDQVDGYAGLDADGLVSDSSLADTGTPSSTTFLRGDRSWSASSTNSVTIQDIDGTPTVTATVLEFPNGTLSDQGGGVARYTAAAPGTVPYVNIQDQKATGTNGGTFTSAAWRTRVLTTIQSDSDAIASLATNQVTLPAGTYECLIRCPASEVDYHQARLQNITDTATILSGTSEYTQSSAVVVMTSSVIAGRFTLAASKALEVQHRCHSTRSGQGFGVAAGASFTVATEVYTIAEFWKVS